MKTHIHFPPDFMAMKWPGYFYHKFEGVIYTMKVTGVLRPLKLNRRNKWVPWIHDSHFWKLSTPSGCKYIAKRDALKYTYEDFTIKVKE